MTNYQRIYDPTGKRHGGTPTFPWGMAPEGWHTRRQLRALELRPGGQEIAGQIIWRRGDRIAYLYRADLAKPKRTATPAPARRARQGEPHPAHLPGLRAGEGVLHPAPSGRVLRLPVRPDPGGCLMSLHPT